MKRRIVLEVDDDLTTAEIAKIGGCEDAFGLSTYVCREYYHPSMIRTAMAEFGITVVSDEPMDVVD